jgi:hypothetical protein
LTAKLMQSVVPLAGHINEVVTAAAIAANTISFTPAVAVTDDMAANEFADGYLHFNASTGQGYMHRIRSHPAITGAVAGVLTLYDPIVVATVAATTKATILHHPLRKIIISDSPSTAQPVGVTVAAVAANAYCWIQYQGPCACLVGGTWIINDILVSSATTDGAIMPSAAFETDGPEIGIAMAVNADTEYGPVYLTLP